MRKKILSCFLILFVFFILFPQKINATLHPPFSSKYNFDVRYNGNKINEIFYLVMSSSSKNITLDQFISYYNIKDQQEKTDLFFTKCFGKDCAIGGSFDWLVPNVPKSFKLKQLALYIPNSGKFFIINNIDSGVKYYESNQIDYQIFNYRTDFYDNDHSKLSLISSKIYLTDGFFGRFVRFYLLIFSGISILIYWLRKIKLSQFALIVNIILVMALNIISLWLLIYKFEFKGYENLIKINLAVLIVEAILIYLIFKNKSKEKITT
jgi:hypothetical protein